jgi:exosortase family protein XrtM
MTRAPIRSRFMPLRFALSFAVVFAVMTGAFEATRGTAFERVLVEQLLLAPTAHLVNLVTPGEQLQLVGRTLQSPASHLHVTRGCEGIELFLLLWAAILAFPADLKRRMQGLAVGGLLAYLLAVARLMVLHYTLRYRPDLWEALHGLVLSLAPVIVLAAYFLRWTVPVPGARLAHAA